MSVIASPPPASRWLHLWPLALFLLVASAGLYTLWHDWPQILFNAARWQRAINQELSGLLRQVAENPTRAGWSLLCFSFGYGVLHALGPGHGKIVIATWLATHPSKIKRSLGLTFAASLLQGGIAVLLVSVVLILLARPSRQLHLSSFWLEKGSYLLVGALGVMIIWRGGRTILGLLRRNPTFTAFTPHHVHHARCGCGHQHVPDEKQLEAGNHWRAQILIVFSIAMRPCSGAIMVLLFSKVIGVFGWGMLSALAMAAGTAITLSALALMVHSFRSLAVRLSERGTPALWRKVGGATLVLAGGGLLVTAALIMWLSAQPASLGIRPF